MRIRWQDELKEPIKKVPKLASLRIPSTKPELILLPITIHKQSVRQISRNSSKKMRKPGAPDRARKGSPAMRSIFRRAAPPATSAPEAAETTGDERRQEREATARRTAALGPVMAASSTNDLGEEIQPRVWEVRATARWPWKLL